MLRNSLIRKKLGGTSLLVVVKNPPSNAGDASLIPGQGTRIPHAAGQLSPCTTTTELVHLNEGARVPQTTKPTCSVGSCAPQLERENPYATTREEPVCSNRRAHTPQRRPCVPQLRPNTAKNKINK